MGTYVYMCIFHILCMEDKNKILIVLNYQLYQLVYLSLGTGKKQWKKHSFKNVVSPLLMGTWNWLSIPLAYWLTDRDLGLSESGRHDPVLWVWLEV